MANEKKTVREPSFILALVPIVAMIGFMLYCFPNGFLFVCHE